MTLARVEGTIGWGGFGGGPPRAAGRGRGFQRIEFAIVPLHFGFQDAGQFEQDFDLFGAGAFEVEMAVFQAQVQALKLQALLAGLKSARVR